MRVPSAKVAKFVAAAATPVAILAASALVWQSSYAAFSGTTRNSGNDWATGSVSLTDDDAGSARFQVGTMTPGQIDTKCIKVTANVSVPGVVKAYVLNPVTSPQGLENYVKITVRGGAGGDFAGCTGFVPDSTIVPGASLAQLTAYNSYGTGVGGWAVAAGTQSRTYEITWTFDTAGLTQAQIDQLQGAHTGLDLQWELQST
ncbi:MAG: hypothetical protein JWO11_1473 [Nocardioides sp.]|nr:hypothetical protein [Nocardioides sp.]